MHAQWILDIETALTAGLNVLGYGPPGTGKTTACLKIMARWLESNGMLDATADRFAIGADMTSADVVGYRDLQGNAVKGLAHRKGLVLDEIGRCSDDATSALLALLDGKPIDTPAGRVELRTPILATSNSTPEEMDAALASRFVWVACYSPADGILATLPSEWRAVAAKSMAHEIPAMPSRANDPRAWLAAKRMRDIGAELDVAARIAGLTDVVEQLQVKVD